MGTLIKKLKDLTAIPGISGYEDAVKDQLKKWIGNYTDFKEDRIGNLIVEVGDGRERIVFLAHIDEIGFIITGVTENGDLSFRKVGGIDDRLIYGRHVDVITETGKIDGVIGSIPPHLNVENKSGVVPWYQLTIDVGAENRDEVYDLGIKPLDFAVFKKHFATLNKKLVSCRSLDDRFGAVVLLEIIKRAAEGELGEFSDRKLVFAFTVQEENGLKGAKFVANTYSPEYAIAIDSFGCCSFLTGDVRFGKGPVIRAVDNSAIYSRRLIRKLTEIADKAKIPVQIGTTGGGTDSSAFEHKSQIATLSVPIKYLHSEVEMIHLDDMKALIELFSTLVKNL